MANLGFIGLGVMGGNMVARLLEKGHTVTGYNRTRSKAQWLIDKGMEVCRVSQGRGGCLGCDVHHGDERRSAGGGDGRAGRIARRHRAWKLLH